MPNWEFQGKYIIQGLIHTISGLHIGGNTEGFEIGGVENSVIRDPLSDQPYIPGSSLKGKLRHLTEWRLGLIDKHPELGGYAAYHCEELLTAAADAPDAERWQRVYDLGRLFGPASNTPEVREMAGPTRLSVRDAFLQAASIQNLEQLLGEGIFTEVKTENALDRVTSDANPRPIERVPRDTNFEFTLILDIYQADDLDLLNHLFTSLRLLEDSALGGAGSRGHGQIKFNELQAIWRSLAYYRGEEDEQPIAAVVDKSLEDIVSQFQISDWTV